MNFTDLHPGLVFEAGPHLVSEAELLDFACQWDPQWFHADPDAARRGAFGGLIASGWHTCAVAMRMMADTVYAHSDAFASPGIQNIRWPHPVRSGDALRLRAEVVDARRSASKPHLGVVRWRWELFNQRDAQVLEVEATSFYRIGSIGPA